MLTLKGWFSAVSTATKAFKGAFFSISQTVHARDKQTVLASRKLLFFAATKNAAARPPLQPIQSLDPISQAWEEQTRKKNYFKFSGLPHTSTPTEQTLLVRYTTHRAAFRTENEIQKLVDFAKLWSKQFSLLQNDLKIDLNCRDLHFHTFVETLMLPFNSKYYNAPEHPPPKIFNKMHEI